MTNLQINETNKSLSELIFDYDNNSPIIILNTQKAENSEVIRSILFSTAKIGKETDTKEFTENNWADIANATKDLAEKNILFANLNNDSIETIISKIKQNKLEVKNVLVDNIERLKSYDNYAELELFLIDSGADVIALKN